jgi:N6-adenosine-specific RNA methylase IME4
MLKICTKALLLQNPCYVEAKSEFHSQKPQVFRDLIEPFGENRLEMFARIKPDGWDIWGNELENDVELETSANNGR